MICSAKQHEKADHTLAEGVLCSFHDKAAPVSSEQASDSAFGKVLSPRSQTASGYCSEKHLSPLILPSLPDPAL